MAVTRAMAKGAMVCSRAETCKAEATQQTKESVKDRRRRSGRGSFVGSSQTAFRSWFNFQDARPVVAAVNS